MVNMIDELSLDNQHKQNIPWIELIVHIYNNMVHQQYVPIFVQQEDDLDNKVMMNRILIESQLVDNVHEHDKLLDSTNR